MFGWDVKQERESAMKTLAKQINVLAVGAALGVAVAGNVYAALDLSSLTYVTYGDANSYALQVSCTIAGVTGPGVRIMSIQLPARSRI